MPLPFTVTQFLDVFAELNETLWPAQIGAYALGVVCVALAIRGGKGASQAVLLLLATAWAFVGIVYHLAFFAEVNPAAKLFGIAFVLEAALLAETAYAERVSFRFSVATRPLLGLALVLYAGVVYPILGASLGHAYPRAPTFGLTPCPTTIFTFGVLLLSTRRVPVHLVAIPFLWSLLGTSAAVHLGIREDLGLVVAGLLGIALLPWRRASARRAAALGTA